MKMERKDGWALSLLLSLVLAGPAQAIPVPDLQVRLGGQAYYDAVLDVTWLADANLAASNAFGVGGIHSSGLMTWHTANKWIAAMNATDYLGFDDWRLPSLNPVSGGSAFNTSFSNNGTTDWGTGATGVGWETLTGAIASELGWMYYGNLGNLGFCTPDNGSPGSCTSQAGFGLVHTAPFSNVQSSDYWSGAEFFVADAWHFQFSDGGQTTVDKHYSSFAWAVRSGDVETLAQVPEPGTMVLLGAALLGFGGAGRAARRAGAVAPAEQVSGLREM